MLFLVETEQFIRNLAIFREVTLVVAHDVHVRVHDHHRGHGHDRVHDPYFHVLNVLRLRMLYWCLDVKFYECLQNVNDDLYLPFLYY